MQNRSVTHTATYDVFPYRRHAVRVTVTAERPMSVEEAEARGIDAHSREAEIYARLGFDDFAEASNKLGDASKAKGYAD